MTTTANTTGPVDYYRRPVQVGDVLYGVSWAPGEFPLWLASSRLTVVKVNRRRVVVTAASMNGTESILPSHACIIERDGAEFPLTEDEKFARTGVRL